MRRAAIDSTSPAIFSSGPVADPGVGAPPSLENNSRTRARGDCKIREAAPCVHCRAAKKADQGREADLSNSGGQVGGHKKNHLGYQTEIARLSQWSTAPPCPPGCSGW